jgi:hypothetical protein
MEGQAMSEMTMQEAAHQYRLAVAQKILDLFEAANGRPARTCAELDKWVGSDAGRAAMAYDRGPDGKIIPDLPA